MDKKTLVTVAIIGGGVLAGIFLWRGVIRPNAPASIVGNKSAL